MKTVTFKGMVFDYSRTFLDKGHLSKLVRLTREKELARWRRDMFSGKKINTTMKTAALHVALRAGRGTKIYTGGTEVVKDVHAELLRMKVFTDRVRSDKNITDIVHIGMGGSVLGPRLVTRALDRFHHPRLRAHFVSGGLPETLKNLSPEKTLFVIVSKTFTTEETMRMMQMAKAWFLRRGGKNFDRHLAGVTVNTGAAAKAGVRPENTFKIWDWVGGRYSVWSAVGITVMMMVGHGVFMRFLKGGREMDGHFLSAPPLKNIPVLMALVGIAHRNIFNYPAYASLPYPAALEFFPLWLQQLDMESNGKSVDRNGKPVKGKTGPVVFGALGEDAQHSFFQWLHQGTDVVPVEFVCESADKNCIYQANILKAGKRNRADPANDLPGQRPSTVTILKKLTPETLGMLLAAYEHKIFTQGVLWNVNSFDQCGVEMVKRLKKLA